MTKVYVVVIVVRGMPLMKKVYVVVIVVRDIVFSMNFYFMIENYCFVYFLLLWLIVRPCYR